MFSIKIHASDPNIPKHNNGIITSGCTADSNTLRSFAKTIAIKLAPITRVANEVDVTAIGSNFFVMLSVYMMWSAKNNAQMTVNNSPLPHTT